MDWLEEKVEKFKRYMQNSSLKRSMLFYLLIAVIGAGTMYLLTRYMCRLWLNVIAQQYSINDILNNISEGGLEHITYLQFTVRDEIIFKIAKFLYKYSFLVYLVGAVLLAVQFFLNNKIKPAMEAITNVIGDLALGDYGHKQSYFSKDEFGKLCDDVENLRLKMIEEKRHHWEKQKEQRDINAAFAHDLRTPLTVMQGYTEFLLKYIPQDKVNDEIVLEKLEIMKEQQKRLFRFSMTMTEIHNIEMRDVNSRWYATEEIQNRIRGVVDGYSHQCGKNIQLLEEKADKHSEVSIDLEILLEIFENLLNNAVRYARENILVQTEFKNRQYTVYVKDDGPGFSTKALREASELYYSEDKTGGKHFGMGLYISSNLCEKHGGILSMINSVDGGAIATASLSLNVRE